MLRLFQEISPNHEAKISDIEYNHNHRKKPMTNDEDEDEVDNLSRIKFIDRKIKEGSI